MSSFICNDITTEAVASGFYHAGYIGASEIPDIADELRFLNEVETGDRYCEAYAHAIPKISGRKFSTAEMVGAARCLFYQCDNGGELTKRLANIFALLKTLPNTLLDQAVKSGEYTTEKYFNDTIYMIKNGRKAKTPYGEEVWISEPVKFPWELDA